MPKTYLVFEVQAYQHQVEDGKLVDVVNLVLVSKNEKEALSRAKKLIDKKFYRCSKVLENFLP